MKKTLILIFISCSIPLSMAEEERYEDAAKQVGITWDVEVFNEEKEEAPIEEEAIGEAGTAEAAVITPPESEATTKGPDTTDQDVKDLRRMEGLKDSALAAGAEGDTNALNELSADIGETKGQPGEAGGNFLEDTQEEYQEKFEAKASEDIADLQVGEWQTNVVKGNMLTRIYQEAVQCEIADFDHNNPYRMADLNACLHNRNRFKSDQKKTPEQALEAAKKEEAQDPNVLTF